MTESKVTPIYVGIGKPGGLVGNNNGSNRHWILKFKDIDQAEMVAKKILSRCQDLRKESKN
jgi:hypothetical protein